MVLIVSSLLSCTNKSELESDTVESYRFMFGSLAADFCVTSMHLLSLNRKNLERGLLEPHDRAVVEENAAALKRMKSDYTKSLSLYADRTRRTRDSAIGPFFDMTIECHELFLKYADARSAEDQANYATCQQRFSKLLQQLR